MIGLLVGLAVGGIAVAAALRLASGSWLETARRTRDLLLDEARRDAEVTRREAQIEAREATVRARAEAERELRELRDQATKLEERARTKAEDAERRIVDVQRREQGIADREEHARSLQEELKEAKSHELAELERISGLTVNQAKAEVLTRSEELVRHELARRVRQAEEEAAVEAKEESVRLRDELEHDVKA
ncbi:MAG: Rnase Y domain-containing protein, partial [Gaiellaceae bacterium]